MQNNIFSGLFVGQNFISVKEVGSTNSFLKEMVSNSKPVMEGTVIMAENQFAGRGQQQNGWHAEPGKNLTFSLLLKPLFLQVSHQFDLVRVISLGVYDALKPLLGTGLKIKWPNDIYCGDKKLAGMLLENMIQGGQIRNTIVGIGVNVNQVVFPETLTNAVSVKQMLQQDYDLKALLSEICQNIEAWYLNLKAGKIIYVRDTYLNRLYRLNEQKLFRSNGEKFVGIIKNVTDNGLLIVENNEAEELKFNLKEIEFLNG